MTELKADLREAFETHGYDVGNVGLNRRRVRIELLEESPKEETLREIVADVVDEELLGVNVTTETIDANDTVGTVVSLRLRP